MDFESPSWNDVLGRLKDLVSIGIAKVKHNHDNLAAAVIKATSHSNSPPKEKHIRRAIAATSPNQPRGEQIYLACALSKRLTRTQNSTVALKTLILIHRLTRDGHPSFTAELQLLEEILHFMEDSCYEASQCSFLLRNYNLYLVKKIKTHKALNCYGEGHHMSIIEQLQRLKVFQQLFDGLLDCIPCTKTHRSHDLVVMDTGIYPANSLVKHAFRLIVKDSLQIYAAMGDAMAELSKSVSKVTQEDALSIVEIFEKCSQHTERLSEICVLERWIFDPSDIQLPRTIKPAHACIEHIAHSIYEMRLDSPQGNCVGEVEIKQTEEEAGASNESSTVLPDGNLNLGPSLQEEACINNPSKEDEKSFITIERQPWVADNFVSYCAKCNKEFGFFFRKHHCRICGNIFCRECSGGRIPLDGNRLSLYDNGDLKSERVCNRCLEKSKNSINGQLKARQTS